MSHKKKRNIIIGVLCTILLLMVVGYAAFSSTLNIKGTSTINSNWDIQITSIVSKTLNGDATNAKDPEGIGTLEASFETNLVSPGDSMEYIITIENKGNINAKLETITVSDPNNEYIEFETSGLEEGSILTPSAPATLTVKVTFKDVEINKMEEITTSLTLTLDYVQADGTGGSGPIGGHDTANKLIALATTTGDGLYADEYESGRYIYKGRYPNNHITFNGESWRIISVETDGTLKIFKSTSLGKMAWDTSDENDWTKASLNTYLNEEYYNSFNEEVKSLIQTHSWGIGPVTHDNTDITPEIVSENSITWIGNIGLMSPNDYIRANTNVEQCGNSELEGANWKICPSTNYIPSMPSLSTDGAWTISPCTQKEQGILYIGGFNMGGLPNGGSAYSDNNVLPVLYLKSDITLSGEGTESNPYTIN